MWSIYENKEDERLAQLVEDLGEGDIDVQFKTGDPLIDKIEEKLAKGEDVDLLAEMFSPEEVRNLQAQGLVNKPEDTDG